MTGKPPNRIPNQRPDVDLDPSLAAIERRLEQRVPVDPPAALRQRVLEKVPATKSGLSAQAHYSSCPDLVAGTFIPAWAWAAAVVLGLALTVPVVASVAALSHSTRHAAVAQLRAAGAVVPIHPALDALPRRPESRALELQRLLEEMP